MSDNYGNDKYREPEKTPKEIEREHCEEIARKRLEHELDPNNFWKLPRAQ